MVCRHAAARPVARSPSEEVNPARIGIGNIIIVMTDELPLVGCKAPCARMDRTIRTAVCAERGPLQVSRRERHFASSADREQTDLLQVAVAVYNRHFILQGGRIGEALGVRLLEAVRDLRCSPREKKRFFGLRKNLQRNAKAYKYVQKAFHRVFRCKGTIIFRDMQIKVLSIIAMTYFEGLAVRVIGCKTV